MMSTVSYVDATDVESAASDRQRFVLCDPIATAENGSSRGLCGDGVGEVDGSSFGYYAATSLSSTTVFPGALSSPRLELVTHGDIWTPDVVQRIATLVPLMVASLLGNAITVVVLTCSKYRKLNSRINIFIINLAIGDLAVCCFTMTTEVSCSTTMTSLDRHSTGSRVMGSNCQTLSLPRFETASNKCPVVKQLYVECLTPL